MNELWLEVSSMWLDDSSSELSSRISVDGDSGAS